MNTTETIPTETVTPPAQDMLPVTPTPVDLTPAVQPVAPVVETKAADEAPPKLKRRIAAAFKTAQVGPSDGNFFISYVTHAGEGVTMPATKEVYDWTLSSKPETECHSDWVINVDAAGVAVGVIRKPQMRQVLPSQIVTDGRYMVLVKSGQSYEPIQLPDRFDVESLSEAIDLLSKTSSYRKGEKLGRFTIKNVVSDTENTYVALDLV